jgi:hypothetical protein
MTRPTTAAPRAATRIQTQVGVPLLVLSVDVVVGAVVVGSTVAVVTTVVPGAVVVCSTVVVVIAVNVTWVVYAVAGMVVVALPRVGTTPAMSKPIPKSAATADSRAMVALNLSRRRVASS